jgi:DNA-binding XRE family transcriptional regulator
MQALRAMSTPLEEARRRQGLNQEQLAARAGVSVKTICRCERGESPRVATMRVLAWALGVTVAELWPERQDIAA